MKNIPDYLYLPKKEDVNYNNFKSVQANTSRVNADDSQYKRVPKKRSNSENAAFHLWLTQIAEKLNEVGWLHPNEMGIPQRYTMEILKYNHWKALLQTGYDIKSTTEMTTAIINDLIDSFVLFFTEKKGIEVPPFPNIQILMTQLDKDKY